MLIEGCLFDDCYASEKGGGIHQDDGRLSIVNSLFFNNTAGSSNEEKGEAGGGTDGGGIWHSFETGLLWGANLICILSALASC